MTHTILLAAGGTGGHIFPAIAFGQYLKKRGENVVWLCGSRPLETEIFSANGLQPEKLTLEGSPLGVRGLKSLARWKSLFSSFFESLSVLRKHNVACCVLFGGYLSLPVLFAARCLRIPVVIHEQNTVAGKVTRLASRMGVTVATAWEECLGLSGSRRVYTGMPLRSIALTDRKDAQRRLLGVSLCSDEKLLVITGGSLGSRGLKKTLQSARNMIKLSGYKVLCMGISESERPFPEAMTHAACWDMGTVYSAADCILCRAGASTLAELKALRIPAVVVPWLGAADNHQQSNARVFSALTGAVVISEDASPDEFLKALSSAAVQAGESENISAGSENLCRVLPVFHS